MTYLSIQNVLVPFPLDAQLNICSIARPNIRLSHEERRPNGALQQGSQPLSLLRLVSIARKHFHIARIRGSTIRCLEIENQWVMVTPTQDL